MEMIKQMHEKFGIACEDIPFSPAEKDFRYTCMAEELGEFKDAKNKADELDALVDLFVFTLGTAERMGMLDVFEEAFARVMEANWEKEVGPNTKRGSFQIDLVKPEGWTAPDLRDLVGEMPETEQLEMGV